MEDTITSTQNTTQNPMLRAMTIRNFRLLWLGQATSLLGDQFHMVAGAWLVLKMTADPLALGGVLAAGGITRAFFTLIGGAVSDRVSPRRLMIFSDIFRLLLSALLAVQIMTGTLQVWMFYVYAILNGILGGLFGPAAMSIIPRLVPEQDLQGGNSVVTGSNQLISFLGPATAGALVAAFKVPSTGAGVAMAFDAITFLVSILTLSQMHITAERVEKAAARITELFSSLRAGIAYLVKDPALRFMFLLMAVANLAFGGPVIVGIPYLANTRFPEGAAAYGLIISGYAGGNLLGVILSGAFPRQSRRFIELFLVAMFAMFAAGLASLGWIPFTWLAMTDLFILGILNGYLQIIFITALQRNTPKEMLGRLMSLVLLAGMSLVPLSQAIAGSFLRWSVTALYLTGGGLLLACAIFLSIPRVSRTLSAKIFEDQSQTGILQ
jgi:MFS family permease